MQGIDFMVSSSGDIEIFENNIKMVEGHDVYIQAFSMALSTRRGEYFLNSEEGLPFDVFIGRKEINEDEVIEALQSTAEQVEEFVKFTRIDWSFNETTRILSISFDALFQEGITISLNEEVNLSV